jgi:FkbM family methyltransferase
MSLQSLALSYLPQPILHRLKKRHYRRLLAAQGTLEEPEFAVITHLVRPGDHVIDVGANYGVYMKFLSDLVGPSGIVHAVEPIPSTFDILASNARGLGLKNVRLLNFAFSDRESEAVMEVPKLAGGGENYYMASIINDGPGRGRRRLRIKTATLDSLFASAPVAFIKCDVEGHELQCVQGALNTVRTARPSWFVEVTSNPAEAEIARQVFALFEAVGYAAYWWDGAALHRRRPGDRSVNYFFLQTQHFDRLSDVTLI